MVGLRSLLCDSFVYSFSSRKKLLFLGLLLVGSVFILPFILVSGYFLRIMESSFNGSNELPPFDNWLKMFMDGLKYLMVSIVYFGVPVLVAIFLMLTVLPEGMCVNHSLMIFGCITLVLMILPYFLMYITLPHMVYNKMRLRKAFDFRNLSKIIKKIGILKYTTAIMLITILYSIELLFTLYLNCLPLEKTIISIINTILQLTVSAYLFIFTARLLSNLYPKNNP